MARTDGDTTGYAVLGMLALRPWTPYELTQQVRRSLRYCWPVSERALYQEPERLVAAGLATVKTSRAGRRVQRTYRASAAGRAALRAWLRTPPAPPRFELEPLLRVMFADLGTKDDLLQSIASFRQAFDELQAEGAAQIEPYLHDEGPFPDRAHLVALFADLYTELHAAVARWADGAEREVASWEGTAGVGMTPGAQRRIKRAVTK